MKSNHLERVKLQVFALSSNYLPARGLDADFGNPRGSSSSTVQMKTLKGEVGNGFM